MTSEDLHRLEVEKVDDWAACSADHLAALIERSIAERGRALVALSGGTTPRPVFHELATRELGWDQVIFLQTDERLVDAESADRNLRLQRQAFDHLPVTWMPLPVDELMRADADVEAILGSFVASLTALADDPPIIDVVQLGLGGDGHTASLFAESPALSVLRTYVALTEPHAGHRRLTLTRPIFDRARSVVWLVSGSSKAEPLGRLLAGDLSIPAGMVQPRHSTIIADTDAARQV